MSDNLDLDQVAAAQAQKELTINDAFGQVDGAITEILLVDLTAGDVSVTMLQAQRYFLLRCSGHAVPRTLTLPAIKRELVIENNGTDTITITRGTTTIDLDAGSLTRVYLDGSANGLIETGGAGSGGVALSDDPAEALGTAGGGTGIEASRSDHVHPAADLAGASTTGTLPIAKGGTGATSEAAARTALGVPDQFTELTDAPASYTGHGGKAVKVKATEDGLEFATAPGDVASAADYRSNVAGKTVETDTVWNAAAEVTLTDAATIAVDLATFINAKVTLAGNRTLGQPTNAKVGQSGIIRIIQDGTGARILAFHADWKFSGGSDPVLSTTAGATDLLFYQVIAASIIYASLVKGIA